MELYWKKNDMLPFFSFSLILSVTVHFSQVDIYAGYHLFFGMSLNFECCTILLVFSTLLIVLSTDCA